MVEGWSSGEFRFKIRSPTLGMPGLGMKVVFGKSSWLVGE